MNTSYPQHHLLHSSGPLGSAMPPTCTYCLNRLGNATSSASERRKLQERHVCVEKVSARQPAVSLPYN